MQIYAVSVLLFASVVLGRTTFSQVGEQFETTTGNDADNSVNSVYSENETPSPPQYPQHMPTTGCFGHLPSEEVDPVKNNIEAVTNFPQPQILPDTVEPQYTPYSHPRSFHGPYRNYYPFNRPAMSFPPPPMPFTPYQRFGFPTQQNSRPIVIVKLLQPIILPVAKPMFPEGGERTSDEEADSERFTNGFNGFHRGHGFHRFSNSGRRFGAEKYRSVERPLPYRQNSFGPYKIGSGEDNIHITVKLH